MSWASHPTTAMPPSWRGRRRRPESPWRFASTVLAACALALLVTGAMLAPTLFGWPPPADTAAVPNGTSPPAETATEPAPSEGSEAANPTPATVHSSPGDDTDALEAQVYALTNVERTQQGCPMLRLDPHLAIAARTHSAHMARTGLLGHPGPDGTDPGERMRLAGYDIGRGWAENIARGQPTAAAVMADWMESTGHRANILDCAMVAIGVGAARDSSGRVYWTQDFGGR